MSNDKRLSYWNGLYDKKNFFGTGPTKLAKYAESLLEKTEISNLLEVGCGQGRDAVHFSQLGYNVNAFDISSKAIKFVEEMKNSLELTGLNLVVHDAEKPLPYPNANFDFVYSNLALQFFNLDQLQAVFTNIAAVMKKDSTLLFSTKKKGDKYYDFGNKINENAFEYSGITRYFFDKSALENVLQKHFKILEFSEDSHKNLDSSVSVWWKILVQK
jgi:ubiquinone/menaquinone biosynthesis C-methylase UbiE